MHTGSSGNRNEQTDSGLPMLWLLAMAGFASLVSMRMCDAMLPALATQFGTSTASASAAISFFAVAYGLMQLLYGPLGDRYGKPRVIALACTGCALAALAAALAPSLRALVLARTAMGAGAAAIVPLAIAWIGDTVPLAQRQAALARYSAATISGIMVGTWTGGFVTDAWGWRSGFYLLAPAFLAVAMLLARRAQWGRAAGPAPPSAPYARRVAALLALSWARTVLATVFIEGVCAFGFLAFVPSMLHDRFALPLTQAGSILATFALGGLAFAAVSRVVLAHLAPPAQARLGCMAMATGFALLASLPDWSWSLLACPLAGFGFFAFHNTLQVHATQLSTTSRGLGVSLFACALFLGQSAGVLLAARVFAAGHPAWGFAGAGLVLTALGLCFARQLQRHRATQVPVAAKLP